MRKSTKAMLLLTSTCAAAAGIGTYLYLKYKDNTPLETFSQDFFEEVSDGALHEESEDDFGITFKQDFVI